MHYTDIANNIDILSYCAYLPTASLDDDFTEILSILTIDISTHRSETSTIIIGLDSNQSKKSSKRRTAVMLDFTSQFSLKSVHISDQPTFHHNNQVSESQIDHILCYLPNEEVIDIKLKEILCEKVNSSNLSSHDAVIGEISLPKPIQNNTQEPVQSSESKMEHIWNGRL